MGYIKFMKWAWNVVQGKVVREARTFNAENRAFREMNKQQQRPKVAPKYDSDMANHGISKEEFIEQSNIANKNLNEHLKQVYVTSTGSLPQVQPNDDRRLPKNTDINTLYDDIDWIDIEENAPPGKLSIKQALTMVATFRESETKNIEQIADDFELDPVDAKNILLNFKSLDLYIPKNIKKTPEEKAAIVEAATKAKYITAETSFPQMVTITHKLPPKAKDLPEKEQENLTRRTQKGDY